MVVVSGSGSGSGSGGGGSGGGGGGGGSGSGSGSGRRITRGLPPHLSTLVLRCHRRSLSSGVTAEATIWLPRQHALLALAILRPAHMA